MTSQPRFQSNFPPFSLVLFSIFTNHSKNYCGTSKLIWNHFLINNKTWLLFWMQYSYSRCQLPEGKLHWQEIIWKAIIREGGNCPGASIFRTIFWGAKVRTAIIRARKQSSRGQFSGEQLSSRTKFLGQSSKGAIFLGGNCLDSNLFDFDLFDFDCS